MLVCHTVSPQGFDPWSSRLWAWHASTAPQRVDVADPDGPLVGMRASCHGFLRAMWTAVGACGCTGNEIDFCQRGACDWSKSCGPSDRREGFNPKNSDRVRERNPRFFFLQIAMVQKLQHPSGLLREQKNFYHNPPIATAASPTRHPVSYRAGPSSSRPAARAHAGTPPRRASARPVPAPRVLQPPPRARPAGHSIPTALAAPPAALWL